MRVRFDPASVAILRQLDDLKSLVQGQTLLLQQQQEALAVQSVRGMGGASAGLGLGALPGALLGGQDTSGTAATGHFFNAPFHPGYDVILSEPLDKASPMHKGAFLYGRTHRNSDVGQSSCSHDARHVFDRYAAKAQTDTDMPVSADAIMSAANDMGIESMLRWPLFRRKLDALRIASHVSVVSVMEMPASSMETEAKLVDGMTLTPLQDLEEPNFVDRARIMELVDNFLVNNNVKNPILEPAGLRADATVFATAPLSWTATNCLMVGSSHAFFILSVSGF